MFKKFNPVNLRLVYSVKTYIFKNNRKKITSCSKAVISQSKKKPLFRELFLKKLYLFIFCGILSLRYYFSDYVYPWEFFFTMYFFFWLYKSPLPSAHDLRTRRKIVFQSGIVSCLDDESFKQTDVCNNLILMNELSNRFKDHKHFVCSQSTESQTKKTSILPTVSKETG